jgi:hypothetical protein
VAKSKTSHKTTWRDYSDANHRSFTTRPNPESLHPSASTATRAITGDEEAQAIIDAYAFRFPVTLVEVLA